MDNQEVIIIDQRPENWGELPTNNDGLSYLSYFCEAPISPDTMVNFSIKNLDNELKGKISSNYIYNQLQNAFHLTKDYIKSFLIEKNEIPENVILQNSIENIGLPSPRLNELSDNLYSIIDRLARRSGRLASLELLEGLMFGNEGDNDLIQAVENYTLQQQQDISKPIKKEVLEKFKRFRITKDFLEKNIHGYQEEDIKKKEANEEDTYQKVISNYRESKNTSLICSMCQDTLKEGELAIALPCKNLKTGEDTPHYFHAFDEQNPDVCIGGNSVEKWLEDNNTCPCCRYEFPEDIQKLEDKKKQVSESANSNLSQYIQNFMSERRQRASQPCQCDRCQERRRRMNMTESERMEDDMIQEAIRRSTINSEEQGEDNTNNSISNEAEELERAIQMSLLEQLNNGEENNNNELQSSDSEDKKE